MPVIHVQMLAGRSQAQKSELAEVLTRETSRIARCPEADIQIVFDEVPRASWAVGGRLVEGHAAAPQGAA
ncbi:tautomerase family protein [Burkholderia sp. Ac-20379]|uniref:tautomerase family protein n=1 Tax=Burkholderia sp. Ac-20379 TaxID=2703900 RepID=UPI001981CB2E|nr:tautomerase family protein [Burkholderia sp. Ac-20379]MBN3724411.1 4-oxalocrotonate tautomerase [Burkholderia sp. Ac-20379]